MLLGAGLAIPAGLLVLQLPIEFTQKAATSNLHLALLNVPLTYASGALIRLFIGLKDLASFAIIQAAQSVLTLLGLVVFLIYFDAGVTGALLSLSCSYALSITLSLAVLTIRHGFRPAMPSFASFKDTIGYGLRYYFGKLSNLVNIQVGTILLSLFAEEAVIGIYAAASAIVNRAQVVPYALNTAMLSRTAEDQEHGRKELVAMSSRLSLITVTAALGVLCLIAEPFVRYILSPSFLPAVPVIRILSGGIALRCGTKLLGTYLSFTNRPGINSLAIASGMLVNLLLLWLLVPSLGAIGAAFAVTANHLVSSFVLMVAFGKYSGFSLRDTWLPKKADFLVFRTALTRFRRRHRSKRP